MLQFSYSVDDMEIIFNIKWTLLAHLRYIVNKLDLFVDRYPQGLPPEHFYDAISDTYNKIPAFAVEYLGKRSPREQSEDIFSLIYKAGLVRPDSDRFGIKSPGRDLMRVHDCILYNIMRLNQRNEFIVYNFTEEAITPRITAYGFSIQLIESSINRDAQSSVVNTFTMIFSVSVNM